MEEKGLPTPQHSVSLSAGGTASRVRLDVFGELAVNDQDMLHQPVSQVRKHLLADPVVPDKAGFKLPDVFRERLVLCKMAGCCGKVVLGHQGLFDAEMVLGIIPEPGEYPDQQFLIQPAFNGHVVVIDEIHKIPVMLVERFDTEYELFLPINVTHKTGYPLPAFPRLPRPEARAKRCRNPKALSGWRSDLPVVIFIKTDRRWPDHPGTFMGSGFHLKLDWCPGPDSNRHGRIRACGF